MMTVLTLTSRREAAKLRCTKKALRIELDSWHNVVITDSSIFRLSLMAMGRPAGAPELHEVQMADNSKT